MGLKPWLSEFIAAHDGYRWALMEDTEAMQAYKEDSSHGNWERLQEALRRLKRQSEIIELNRR
jgi:hypothetical protein